MASEFLADIEGKLEKLTEPHHVSKLSRYDSYSLGSDIFIVMIKMTKNSRKYSLTDIQAYLKICVIIARVVYYQKATKKHPTG